MCLGAISGTSVDGLDLALVRFDENTRPVDFVAGGTVPLPADLRRTLVALGQADHDDIDHLGTAHAALGRFIGEAIKVFLKDHSIDPDDVSAIGSHGQTVRHRPTPPDAFTLQIGDPSRIAEITGITTVADFRSRDVAAGGQGAPLVPPFHDIMFRAEKQAIAVVNIGGISNVTLLPPDPSQPLTGYDTGPGNALLDAWIGRHRNQAFDVDGIWAASGNVNPDLLSALLADPYLADLPPKSTGKEHYNLPWLTAQYLPLEDLPPEDVQRTLVDFTAQSIVQAISRWEHAPVQILVCGGGRLNPLLMQRMGDLAGVQVKPVESVDVDGDSLEAAAFAWLAARTLSGLSGNAPAVTGAQGERILGAIYPAF
jgi:anhydro-N-acetylmuramic acid kinase